MPESTRKLRKKFFKRLKYKYRMVFYNDKTFEEAWQLRFTLRNILSIAGTVIIILVFGSMALVMFTPLRVLVPGYPTDAMRRQIETTAIRLDSLEYEIYLRDKYMHAVNAIIAGREPELTEAGAENKSVNYESITFTRSEQDSLLRRHVEEEERFNFMMRPPSASVPSPSEEASISRLHFFKPVNGVVSNKFHMNQNHFGVDIVAAPNEAVKSTLDGTVTIAAWTLETGYMIQVQHMANLISIYKHNAKLLKKQGDRVKAGDAIAIVGNSGELTTGPHLHFEIWQNGTPVNPEDYIVF